MKFNCLSEIESVMVYNPYTHFIDCRELKDLEADDQIYTGGNNFAYITSMVKSKSPDVVKITLMHNKAIYATLDHVFPVADGTLKEVRDLSPGDELMKNKDWNIEIFDTLDVIRMLINNNMDKDFSIKGDIIQTICEEHDVDYYFANEEATAALCDIKKWIYDYDYSNCVITTGSDYAVFKTKYPITESMMTLLGYYLSKGFGNRYIVNSTKTKEIESIKKGLAENFPYHEFETITVEEDTHIYLEETSLHSVLFDFVFGCKTLDNRRKFPEFIFNIDFDMKKAFLKGLFSDGTLNLKRAKGSYCEMIFHTNNIKTYGDLCMLLTSMDVNYTVDANWNESLNRSSKNERFIEADERAKVTVVDIDDFERISDIASDYPEYDEYMKIIAKNPVKKKRVLDHRYIVSAVERFTEKITVVDINIDTDEKLFVTSHGIISHNCQLGPNDLIVK